MLPIVNLWLKSADIKHSGRWGKGNGSVRFRQADRTATEAGHWENCKPNNSSLWLSCGGVSTSKKQKSRRIWRGSLWTGIRLASLKSHTTQNCGQLLQPHKFWVVIGGDTNVRDVIIVSFTHTQTYTRDGFSNARVSAAGPVFQSTGNSRGRMQCAESGRTCHSHDLNFVKTYSSRKQTIFANFMK